MADLYLYRELFWASTRDVVGPSCHQVIPELFRLMDLKSKGAPAAVFAEEALMVLRQVPGLAELDRVCLSQIAPGTALIHVLGSANSGRVAHNRVQTGYHCYIADTGSLAMLASGRVRVYDDASQVVASYLERHQPPQRTIRRIADMGLRAGLALTMEFQGARGVVFLNSIKPGQFTALTPDDQAAIGLVSLIARGYLRPVSSDIPRLNWSTGAFHHRAFTERLQAAVALRFGQHIRVTSEAWLGCAENEFIWTQDVAIQALLEGIRQLLGVHQGPAEVLMTASPVEDHRLGVRLRLARTATGVAHEDLHALRFLLAPWSILVNAHRHGGIDLAIPIDASFQQHDSLFYSV